MSCVAGSVRSGFGPGPGPGLREARRTLILPRDGYGINPQDPRATGPPCMGDHTPAVISDREQQACNLDRLRGLRDQAAVHSGLRGPCTMSSSRTSTSGCDKRPYSEDVNWKNRKQAGEGKYKILQARGCIPESMNLEALASAEHSHYTSWPRSG